MIFNPFKYSGISCSLDKNEDDMFRGYEDFEKGNETIEIENEQGSDQEDEYIYVVVHQIRYVEFIFNRFQ